MQITERILDREKSHTFGYVLSGREYTRREVVQFARRGNVSNVRVVNSEQHGPYLMGTEQTLYDLPTRYSRSRRLANAQ